MRVTHSSSVIRQGFTLVEVMVAAALSVVIMTIISYAFQVGLETTSQLKSIGGLADQLRTAHSIIRSDLRATHLSENGVGDKSVSTLTASPLWGSDPNHQGFFRVTVGGAAPERSGATDAYGMGSSISTDSWLHFTVKLDATAPEDAFAAVAPPQAVADPINLAGLAAAGQFASQWAEVAYFLAPMGTSTIVDPADPPGATAQQLHTLRRRQRVMANDALAAATVSALSAVNVNDFPELSLNGNPASVINTPSTITTVANRLGGGAIPATLDTNPAYRGSDIVLGNVVSMRVMVLTGGNVEFTDLAGGTWDSATAITAQLRAIRIQLRVYEPKNRLTRQISIDQAL